MTKEELVEILDTASNKKGALNLGERQKIYESFKSLTDEELKMLILPKRCYAAEAIQFLGYPRIKPLFPDLLVWYQDLDWPGIETITETLQTIDKRELQVFIEEALQQAIDEDDEMWIGGIKKLTERLGIGKKDFSSKALYKVMKSNDMYG